MQSSSRYFNNMDFDDVKRRKDLAILNLCQMQNCKFYNGLCAHDIDAVDKRTGEDICPLNKNSVDRNYFKG